MPTGRIMSSILVGIAVGRGIGACLALPAASAQADDKHPVVVLDTSMGPITIELDREKAPITVENFLKYVDDGFYDNLIFHRVIPDFMIQGGGFDQDMREKTEGQHGTIKNESSNGLSNATRHDRDGPHARPRLGSEPVLHQRQGQQAARLPDRRRLRGLRQGDRRHGRRRQDRQGRGRRSARACEDVPVEPVVIKTARRKAKS